MTSPGHRGLSLPFFHPADDPGPSFSELLNRITGAPVQIEQGTLPEIAHGTTIVALRFAGGVILAGDRRATAGNVIAHRHIEKIHPADRHSGVGIAGAAGPAMEMVRLFQTELEHYEKVEGSALSLDGKANKLAQMIRGHLPAAMQGMAVVPIFCGFDQRRDAGRIFNYDVTGGRYEETDFATTGSGGRDARALVKQRWTAELGVDEAIGIAAEALFEAADEDSATGGPDPLRGIYPQVATITAAGFELVEDDVVSARFADVMAARNARGGDGA